MIIVPLDSGFGRQSGAEQNRFIDELQARSNAAGLRGTATAVWNGGFHAPHEWHAFFRSLSVQAVQANINREVSW